MALWGNTQFTQPENAIKSVGSGWFEASLNLVKDLFERFTFGSISSLDAMSGILLLLVLNWAANTHGQSSEYEFQVGVWSECSTSCNLGVQTRVVSCVRSADGEIVQEAVCTRKTPPPSKRQLCNIGVSCDGPPELYLEYKGQQCSSSCGGGKRIPVRACRRRSARGAFERLPVERCANITDNIPTATPVPCNENVACPPRYLIGQWSSCTVTCGSGYRFRRVRCYERRRGKNTRVSLAYCRERSGHMAHRMVCDAGVCPDNYQWRATNWTLCSVICQQTREVKCYSLKDDADVHPFRCAHSPEPATFRRCVRSGNLVWQASNWSQCSRELGICGRQRRVSCVHHYTKQKARSCPICLKPHEVEKCAFFQCPQESAAEGCIVERGPDGEGSEQTDEKKCHYLQGFKAIMHLLCNIQRIKEDCPCSCLPYSNSNKKPTDKTSGQP